MNYQETLNYLYNSTPVFEHVGAVAYKEGLQNTLALDKHFNHPHTNFKTMHICWAPVYQKFLIAYLMKYN